MGTFEGNVMIENGVTKLLNDKNSPLSKAYISKVYEDKKEIYGLIYTKVNQMKLEFMY